MGRTARIDIPSGYLAAGDADATVYALLNALSALEHLYLSNITSSGPLERLAVRLCLRYPRTIVDTQNISEVTPTQPFLLRLKSFGLGFKGNNFSADLAPAAAKIVEHAPNLTRLLISSPARVVHLDELATLLHKRRILTALSIFGPNSGLGDFVNSLSNLLPRLEELFIESHGLQKCCSNVSTAKSSVDDRP